MTQNEADMPRWPNLRFMRIMFLPANPEGARLSFPDPNDPIASNPRSALASRWPL